ncbi:hypothetical protein RUND412_008094 [Rhizina undulata]
MIKLENNHELAELMGPRFLEGIRRIHKQEFQKFGSLHVTKKQKATLLLLASLVTDQKAESAEERKWLIDFYVSELLDSSEKEVAEFIERLLVDHRRDVSLPSITIRIGKMISQWQKETDDVGVPPAILEAFFKKCLYNRAVFCLSILNTLSKLQRKPLHATQTPRRKSLSKKKSGNRIAPPPPPVGREENTERCTEPEQSSTSQNGQQPSKEMPISLPEFQNATTGISENVSVFNFEAIMEVIA